MMFGMFFIRLGRVVIFSVIFSSGISVMFSGTSPSGISFSTEISYFSLLSVSSAFIISIFNVYDDLIRLN
ncbi:MAG: hypothetical protein KJ718_01155 [Nanoarchaeota archaeon]|nr:hypothetical protein [Nanoarchaeota archaeon]